MDDEFLRAQLAGRAFNTAAPSDYKIIQSDSSTIVIKLNESVEPKEPNNQVDYQLGNNLNDEQSFVRYVPVENCSVVVPQVKVLEPIYLCTKCNIRFDAKSAFEKHVVTMHALTEVTVLRQNVMFGESSKVLQQQKRILQIPEYSETPLSNEPDYTIEIEAPTYVEITEEVETSMETESIEQIIQSENLEQENLESVPNKSCRKRYTGHMSREERYTSEKKLLCNECNVYFRHKTTLRHHKIKAHNYYTPHVCKYCSMRFPNPHSLVSHERVHTRDFTFPCYECSQRFKLQEDLQKHRLEHKIARHTELDCVVCHKTFRTRRRLIIHYREWHKPITNPVIYECPHCDEFFYHKKEKNSHRRFKHPNNEKRYLRSRLSRFKRMMEGSKLYNCDYCNKNFYERPSFVGHIRKHVDKAELTCQYCGRLLSTKASLRNHVRIHLNDRPYECKYCGKKYVDQRTCIEHEKTHTTAPTLYTCRFCNLIYRCKIVLFKHLKQAHNAFYYVCDICQQDFKRENNLNLHKKIMHQTDNFP